MINPWVRICFQSQGSHLYAFFDLRHISVIRDEIDISVIIVHESTGSDATVPKLTLQQQCSKASITIIKWVQPCKLPQKIGKNGYLLLLVFIGGHLRILVVLFQYLRKFFLNLVV